MLIRGLRHVSVAGIPGGLYPGWVGDVEDGRAQRLIDAGHAVSAEKLEGRDPALAVAASWGFDSTDHTTMDDRDLTGLAVQPTADIDSFGGPPA